MKKAIVMLLCVVALMGVTTSCSSLSSAVSSATSSNTAATTLGASTGTALTSLYTSYKSAGKLDLTNTTNLSNALILCNAYTQLKANESNQSYRTAFASGMVTGGGSLITSSNATSIMTSLLSATGLSGVNSSNISSTLSTASTIITLLNALKQ